MKEVLSEGWYEVKANPKHFYVGIYGDKRVRRELREALLSRWESLPYPKRERKKKQHRAKPHGYNFSVNIQTIINDLDAEIARLTEARNLIAATTKTTTGKKRGRPVGSKVAKVAKKKRKMSAEGKARIIAAQKARWAKIKKDKKA